VHSKLIHTSLDACTGVPIPNDISIGSAVFAQLTAESSHTLQWATPFPHQNSHGDLDFRLIHGFFGPTESTTQTASRSVQRFLQGSLL